MNFAGGDAFLKNPSVRRKFLKVDFGEPGPIFENRAVCSKFRKLDFDDGRAVLLKRRKLDFGDGGADSEKPVVCSKS